MAKLNPKTQEAAPTEAIELPNVPDLNPQVETGAREAADLEEKLQAELLAQARQTEEAIAGKEEVVIEEPPLAALAAQGREFLLNKLREHQQKPKAEYVPPPLTEKMQANINAELEAGRRTQAKHQAQWDARPAREVDPTEGTSTPVHRPGDHRPSINSRIL